LTASLVITLAARSHEFMNASPHFLAFSRPMLQRCSDEFADRARRVPENQRTFLHKAQLHFQSRDARAPRSQCLVREANRARIPIYISCQQPSPIGLCRFGQPQQFVKVSPL